MNFKCIILWLACALALAFTQTLNAGGILLQKQRSGESEEFWRPLEFVTLENFAVSVVVKTTARAQGVSIPKTEVGVLLELPDLTTTSVVSEQDIKYITGERAKFAAFAARYKQAANILNRTVRDLDVAIAGYNAGNVLVSGRWLTKAAYEAELTVSRGGTIPEITVAGRTYKNVSVREANEDTVSIMHDGGVASFSPHDLSSDALKKLHISFPNAGAKGDSPGSPEPSTTDTMPPLKAHAAAICDLDPVTLSLLLTRMGLQPVAKPPKGISKKYVGEAIFKDRDVPSSCEIIGEDRIREVRLLYGQQPGVAGVYDKNDKVDETKILAITDYLAPGARWWLDGFSPAKKREMTIGGVSVRLLDHGFVVSARDSSSEHGIPSFAITPSILHRIPVWNLDMEAIKYDGRRLFTKFLEGLSHHRMIVFGNIRTRDGDHASVRLDAALGYTTPFELRLSLQFETWWFTPFREEGHWDWRPDKGVSISIKTDADPKALTEIFETYEKLRQHSEANNLAPEAVTPICKYGEVDFAFVTRSILRINKMDFGAAEVSGIRELLNCIPTLRSEAEAAVKRMIDAQTAQNDAAEKEKAAKKRAEASLEQILRSGGNQKKPE